MKRRRAPLPILLLAAFAATAAHAAVDPFYQGLLRDGQQAYDRKDYTTAAHDLRLACFGMLDAPPQLAGCLSRLALAQDAAGDVEGFRQSFQRLVEVEDRFKGYSQGDLPQELRTALEARLAARIPAATLAGTPAFRSASQAGRKGPAPASPNPVPASGAQKPQPAAPQSQPQAPAPAPAKPSAAGQPSGPAGPASSAAAPAARPLSDAERQKLEQARQLLGDRRTVKELRQAFELARAVADAHPESKDAQLLAAEGAYRISRWNDAAAYFRRGGDPGEDQPERLFYMAVSLYESGDRAAAAAALKRSLPNLKRTPYVDGYAKKILGKD